MSAQEVAQAFGASTARQSFGQGLLRRISAARARARTRCPCPIRIRIRIRTKPGAGTGTGTFTGEPTPGRICAERY